MWSSSENPFTRSNSYKEGEEGDDEEALRWAALERLPTYNRVRRGIFKNIVGDFSEIDVGNLELQDHKLILGRLVDDDDLEQFFRRLRQRFDIVDLEFPKIEVRFEQVKVGAYVREGSRALPTIPNFIINMTEAFLRKLRIIPGKRKQLSILDNISGIIRPSRLTLLLGPPSSGKTTLLLALAGRLGPGLQMSGSIKYNGHDLKEFVPQRTSAYVSQQDSHIAEMTVRETLEFSGRCQGVGIKYDMLLELSRREKNAGIKPDEDLDIFIKALALGGQKTSLVVEYILKHGPTYTSNSTLRVYDYLEPLHNSIVNAVVNQGAQEILIKGRYISQKSSNMFHFNPSIFTSGSLLRKFTFDVYNRHYLIQFPRSMCCATHLTHLTLHRIRLPEGDDESNAQLHLVCPVLETFHMSYCCSEHLKVLDISAPRLYSLSICNTGMRNGYLDALGGCRLEIRTPNLTTLNYSGCAYVDCFTENLPHVFYANLNLTEERNIFTVEQTTSFAIKLLKGLTTAEFLILAVFKDTLKDLLLLTPFTSLRYLCLITSFNISNIHGMVHFLNNCNSLEELFWDVTEFIEVEGDEDLMLPQCRLSQLKHVQIKRLHGHVNEIEFVKFLLKSSVVLEDLIIITTKNSRKRLIEEYLKQFIEEEPSVRRGIKLYVLEEESQLSLILSSQKSYTEEIQRVQLI